MLLVLESPFTGRFLLYFLALCSVDMEAMPEMTAFLETVGPNYKEEVVAEAKLIFQVWACTTFGFCPIVATHCRREMA